MSAANYREAGRSRRPAAAALPAAPPDPVWQTKRKMDNLVITPCAPIPLRLSNVRVQWEPSSYVEKNERKNIFFELNDDAVRTFLEAQEDKLKEEWGFVNSCLAKPGLLKCKINSKRVKVFDKDRTAIAAPEAWSGWGVNTIVKPMGRWRTPDGSATGLILQATDVQLLAPKQRHCPF